MSVKRIFDAPTAWNQLNGIINVYKPAGIRVIDVRNAVLSNLCKGKRFEQFYFDV